MSQEASHKLRLGPLTVQTTATSTCATPSERKGCATSWPDIVEADHPLLADKLRQVTPLWIRHSHATHALAGGATRTTMRDNLRHASISTTSIYLDGDDVQRTQQIQRIFTRRPFA
ncbi:integrase [Pandoraea horticolens]|uniref:Integrase n=1 Tax=Pandoraea horticolens TaxID=2508298 RepID=A0A5E4YRT9_9BURK|nr:integrase [Pandoraea horticolens]